MNEIFSSMHSWNDLRVVVAWKELSRIVGIPATVLSRLGTAEQRESVRFEAGVVAAGIDPPLDDLRLGSQRTARGLAIWRNTMVGFALYMLIVTFCPVGGPGWLVVVAAALALAYQAHVLSTTWDAHLLRRFRYRWAVVATVRVLASDKRDLSDYAVKVRAWVPLSPNNTFTDPVEEFLERMGLAGAGR